MRSIPARLQCTECRIHGILFVSHNLSFTFSLNCQESKHYRYWMPSVQKEDVCMCTRACVMCVLTHSIKRRQSKSDPLTVSMEEQKKGSLLIYVCYFQMYSMPFPCNSYLCWTYKSYPLLYSLKRTIFVHFSLFLPVPTEISGKKVWWSFQLWTKSLHCKLAPSLSRSYPVRLIPATCGFQCKICLPLAGHRQPHRKKKK